MPTPTNKTNFKTYEASTRLLAAVVASTMGKVKLDFKELAALMGGGTTSSAVDHRLRPIKQLAKMQLACRKEGKDPGQLPVDTTEIQRLFGESTPGGIEWQFREIKALGSAQKAAVANGEDPAKLKVPGAGGTPARTGRVATTPGSRTGKRGRGGGPSSSAASTPSARAAAASAIASSKRKQMMAATSSGSEVGDDSDYDNKDLVQTSLEDEDEDDGQEQEQTPTQLRATKRARTLSTSAAESPSPHTPVTSKSTSTTAAGGTVLARSLFASANRGNGGSKKSGPTPAPTKRPNVYVIDDDDDDHEEHKLPVTHGFSNQQAVGSVNPKSPQRSQNSPVFGEYTNPFPGDSTVPDPFIGYSEDDTMDEALVDGEI
ncbi:hypothetical protein GGS23DRAFT_66059 [Durotheca rogersii]|uniref:uncharacterized protein n=1 Tax=Durotheca rogersii TaxID=419775 RepID=UPI00221F0D10|nr:uncharacterized protein GGS23DRAFT_66059 [Durotheca rogersii]KAI5862772.1 hypothetical protein GGS23DRAFT_66059 [Durotheca rogersii]